ncbi:MATE family efflux transporter [Lachnoclostridium sp. An298]|uniref:MATE family efflux transporter n=1 Tax=Mediterraneibacter glycyrrhizinilyticus TaxID=342942 RepID=UPI000B36C3B4|nr:MATE family efflux transporter [Mediterraneibacter glycyrrhizinilyticus]MDN0045161.1 MATE family efflux transporter [Mediterraneibacter glycyrrhizinilyticus]OUO26135.1 MATE family efflux transporter [Lachnoclostridium sp. An298]
MKERIGNLFLKYVSANVLGMIGYSCYILADTFFIARGIGADALAALNLVLPAYSLMNGTGLMIGMGAASRYTISSTKPEGTLHRTIFTQALYLAAFAAVIFSSGGIFLPDRIAAVLGANADTIGYATDYIRILLIFSPLFLGNNLLLSFVRNDGAPRLSMTGMIVGSLTNIVLDYVFIYPLGMGMTGAALATATAPVISMLIMSVHFIKKRNHFRPVRTRLSLVRWGDICTLGVSSLVTELSSGVVIIVFNYLILGLNGNTGVAAYGILANIALVLVSIYTGIGQGVQPIVSRYAGKDGEEQRRSLRRYALATSLSFALLSYLLIAVFAVPLAELFNREHDPILTDIASNGMRIYFVSLFFSGINIVAAAFLSSADRPKQAFVISILRGFVLIIPVAWILSVLFGLTGIWMAVPVTEAIVCALALIFLFRKDGALS